jgi:predicted dehydrogenase
MISPLHRVLVIGTGSIGERHTRCFLATDRVSVKICELKREVRLRVAETYNVESCVALEQALENPPEIAVICTPAHLHVPIARQLVLAGSHVLVEKPLSTSLDGVDQLCWEAEQAEQVVAVAYVSRQNPMLAEMKLAIDSGRFGKPLQLIIQSGQHFPTYRPAFRETYYRDRETGGGAIQDGLTHSINTAEWLVGPADRVAADCDRLVLDGVNVEDTVHVIARHGSVMASYTLNQHQAPNETRIQVVCEKGVVRYESHQQRWRSMVSPGNNWIVENQVSLERDDLFIRQAEMFLDAVENGSAVSCNLAEGLQTLQVNLAILAAADTGSWQQIQAVTGATSNPPQQGSP